MGHMKELGRSCMCTTPLRIKEYTRECADVVLNTDVPRASFMQRGCEYSTWKDLCFVKQDKSSCCFGEGNMNFLHTSQR
jgi:hypothetical protein